MLIAGVQLDDGHVAELATRLDRAGAMATGGKLRRALFVTAVAVQLDVPQQREVIAALASDCPPGLVKLRDVLTRQESFRAHHAPPG